MHRLLGMAIALGLACFAHGVAAETYPSRPITVVCGYAAGTGADVLTRYFAEKLRTLAGQPVVVENRSGASQMIGAEALAKLSTHSGIQPHVAMINDLEHRADGLLRASVGRLFRESTDAIEVIKLRDLYQQLEEAVDAAQDAGKVISRILAKHH